MKWFFSFLSLFIGLRESKTFEDQALAPGSNQKRLLNFYKELAMNLSAVADVTADEPSLRALALLLDLRLREPHLRSLRSLALCKSLVSGKQ